MKRHLSVALVVIAAAGLIACEDLPSKPKEGPNDGPAPSVAVSEPFTHSNLTIFLLRGKDTLPAGHQLLTLQEAMEQKKVVVHETSTVNELSIENVSTDAEVFVQAGDIVRGGKQDRLMACDMVVPPKSGHIAIPSFCCESGRWTQRGKESAQAFNKSDQQAANKDVKLALNAARDQGRVWDEVKKAQMKLSEKVGKPVNAPESPSSYQLALEDKDLQAKIDAYVKALAKVTDGKDDAIGFAIVVNGKVEGAEVYGSSALFRKLWPKLLKCAAIDALAEFQKDKKFDAVAAKDVEKFLADAAAGPRKDVALASLGEGRNRQTLNQAPNAARPNVDSPAQGRGAAQATEPPADAKPGRVRLVQSDNGKILMTESQDGKAGNAVLHRSYIAK
ncbi:MAG: ARPP-1 family domain-containing protein [Gemmataceae bacterium]